MNHTALAGSLLGCVLLSGNLVSAGSPPAPIDFDRDIRPVFAANCLRCHGPEKQKSGLRLDQRADMLRGGESGEPAVVPGKGADSHLIKLVRGTPKLVMPPGGKKLTDKEIALLTAWIDQGAKWSGPGGDGETKLTTTHWSFQPLTKITPPNRAHPWVKNEIDAFVLDRLQKAGLQPTPPADRVTLIRRVYLDMLGLPPTPEQVQRFVTDARPDAYDRLVDEVLVSPHYGERWGQHWLDVVRYADTHGFETNTPRPNAWPYRDYVIKAFNDDKPYDRFLFEQIAGDSVGMDVALGFLTAGPQDQVKSPDPVLTNQQRQDELNEILNAASSTFLGLTVSCARCHNHKFDPILQKDYYALQAVFSGVRYGDRPMTSATDEGKKQQLAKLQKELDAIQEKLRGFEPTAFVGQTVVIDDEDRERVQVLIPKTGKGTNPAGTALGEKDFSGDSRHLPNLSKGGYSWWNQQNGKDVFAYTPKVAGKFGIWLSWGCGWDTHVKDARYELDTDGDLTTLQDRKRIATVDQQKFADGSGTIPGRPLWSGLYFAGVHDLTPTSRIVLQAGTTGPATTADVIVLQPAATEQPLPHLRAPVLSRHNVERIVPVPAKYVRFTVSATNNGIEPCIDELELWTAAENGKPTRNVAPGAKATSSGNYAGSPLHKLEHINDGQYGNGRSWISNEAGKGWVQLELTEPALIERIVWGRDHELRYKDRTAVKYKIEIATEPGLWQTVASSEDRLPYLDSQPETVFVAGGNLPADKLHELDALQKQRQALESGIRSLTQSKMVFAAMFQQPGATYRLYRGDPMAPREVVVADTLTVFGSLNLSAAEPEQKRRVALANWIIARDNPLTARVLVNRVWQYHFGTGIVATPSDFGKMGGVPSHPELLDWLATRFMADGWSLKKLHRLILLSNTYQQAATPNTAALKIDADCRLLWRFPPRRLEAEVIRDSILAVSGALNTATGGPGFSLFEPNENYVRVYDPKKEFGPGEWRRMIYAHKVRMEQDAVFGAFDCPDAGQPAPKRTESTTPIQALNLFNSSFLMQQAEMLAKRVERNAGADVGKQVGYAFTLALGRSPTETESRAAVAVVREHGLPTLCRVLFNANEFVFLP